jgi:hypothetical protein
MLHDPLPSSGRLVGILRPVVKAFVLPMLDTGHDLPLGGGVAAQLVGDQHPRCSPLFADSDEGGHLFQTDVGHHSDLMAARVVSSPRSVLVIS